MDYKTLMGYGNKKKKQSKSKNRGVQLHPLHPSKEATANRIKFGKENFDDFVKQLAHVEERTSGEPGAGVPRPSAASKGTFGVSMDIKNLKNVNVLDIAASAASSVTSAAAALQETAFGSGQAQILGALIREIDEDLYLAVLKAAKQAQSAA